MILDIAVAYSDGMKKLDEIAVTDAEMERISNNLHTFVLPLAAQQQRLTLHRLRCLESISKAIQNQPKAGLFKRMLTQSATRQRIKGWQADLEQISLHFTVIVDYTLPNLEALHLFRHKYNSEPQKCRSKYRLNPTQSPRKGLRRWRRGYSGRIKKLST
jgi:hypothetical protein